MSSASTASAGVCRIYGALRRDGAGRGLPGAALQAIPALYTVLACRRGHLLYFAWQIATRARPNRRAPSTPAHHISGSMAFQRVNLKGWVMAVGAVSTYAAVATFPGNAVDHLLVRHARHPVERNLARLRHEPAPAAEEPWHRARRQHRHGCAVCRPLAYLCRRGASDGTTVIPAVALAREPTQIVRCPTFRFAKFRDDNRAVLNAPRRS